jgi:hypothetical protein
LSALQPTNQKSSASSITDGPPPPFPDFLDEVIQRELSIFDALTGEELILGKTPQQEKIETDWRTWLDAQFKGKLFAGFAPHHERFWDWVWDIKRGVRSRPFVAIWPRGGAKSTSVEMACALVGCTGKRKHIWYICETQEQADQHVANIGAMLESPEFARLYPEHSRPLLNQMGMSRGWKANLLRTSGGLTILAIGLRAAKRGFKTDFQRPDLFILDDVDARHDSPEMTAKKVEMITESLLPSGSGDFTVLAVQNLIHKNSIFSQLARTPRQGGADWLSDRIISGPVKALNNFRYERIPDDTEDERLESAETADGCRWRIISGTPTWSGMDEDECYNKIKTYGIQGFLRECQHEVDIPLKGALFPEFDELFHVVTESEMIEFFGELVQDEKGEFTIPFQWSLARTQDWGATPGHPCVTLYGARPYQGHPLNDCAFIYREIVLPEFPLQEDSNILISPKRVKQAMFDAQKKYGERGNIVSDEEPRIIVSKIGHESSPARNTYIEDQGDGLGVVFFDKSEPNRQAGIPQIQNYLSIDYSKPHPFRKFPKGFKLDKKDVSNLRIMGRPRIFLVVKDEQGALYVDPEGQLKVKDWKNAAGLARLRWEIPKYRNHVDTQGNEAPLPKNKKDDDAVDALKNMAEHFFAPLNELTRTDKIEALLPQNSKMDSIMQLPENERAGAFASRQHQVNKIEKQMGPKVYGRAARMRKQMKDGR